MFSFIFDEGKPYEAKIIMKEGLERSDFARLQFSAVCAAPPQREQILLATLKEITAPHRRGSLEQFERGDDENRLSINRIKMFLGILVNALNGYESAEPVATPFSYETGLVYYGTPIGKEGMKSPHHITTSFLITTFNITREIDAELGQNVPFSIILTDKNNEPHMKEALISTLYVMHNSEFKLKQRLGTARPGSLPNGGTSEPGGML